MLKEIIKKPSSQNSEKARYKLCGKTAKKHTVLCELVEKLKTYPINRESRNVFPTHFCFLLI